MAADLGVAFLDACFERPSALARPMRFHVVSEFVNFTIGAQHGVFIWEGSNSCIFKDVVQLKGFNKILKQSLKSDLYNETEDKATGNMLGKVFIVKLDNVLRILKILCLQWYQAASNFLCGILVVQ